jgi:hypothetical protein
MSRPAIVASLAAVVLAVGTALLRAFWPETLRFLCKEDGIVESLTAAAYFLAACAFLWVNRRHAFRNVWLWLYFALFLGVAGEEIDWGQRILGVRTPDALMEANVQQEINLHNMQGIHGNVRMVGLVVVLGICYAIPIAHRFSASLRRRIEATRMPVFPLELWLPPLLAIALMAVPRIIFRKIIFHTDEMGEVLLSFTFLLFAARVLRSPNGLMAATESVPREPRPLESGP